MKKIKERWGIESNLQFWIIMIVFAITGSSSAWLRNHVMNLIGLPKETTEGYIYYPVSIFLIFVVYQILLLVNGAIFGQWKFFWAFEKKMLSRLGFKSLQEQPAKEL